MPKYKQHKQQIKTKKIRQQIIDNKDSYVVNKGYRKLYILLNT